MKSNFLVHFKQIWFLAVVSAFVCLNIQADESLKRSRYLLLDSRIIAEKENVKLSLGTVKKHSANPLFEEDKKWEMRFDNLYGNVIYDKEEKIYKCWYSPFTQDRSSKGMTFEQRQKKYGPGPGRKMSVCYATSKDGIKWDKPNLGLVDYKGSKENNIVIMGPHGAGVIKDTRTKDASRRYKMVMQGVKTAFSADGVNWSKAVKKPEIGGHGDTHNNALWSPVDNKYVLITRAWMPMKSTNGRRNKARVVSRSVSADFETWTKAENVIEPENYPHQPYSMPTFYHGGVYIGIIAVHHQPPVDKVWPELAWSTDTVTWHRIEQGKSLIPLAEKKLAYDYGCIYTCANPVFLENEIRIYYGASDYLHYGWRNGSLCLATLRPDGFAGYEPASADKSGTVTTSSIPYSGEGIRISADIEAGGEVKVSLVNDSGNEIAKAQVISQTATDQLLKFDVKIESKNIRLKFEITKAKIYSFSFK